MPQRILDFFFRFHIHCRCGIVQDQDGRLHRQSSCQGDTLFLTAGKTNTTFSDDRIISVRHTIDEGCCCRKFCALRYFFERQMHITVRDIAFDRIGIQKYILVCQTDVFAQTVQRIILHRHTVDQDLPAAHFVEARDQIDQRRLAASGLTHDRHRLLRLDRKGNIIEHRHIAVFITERYIAELDLSVEMPFLFDTSGIIMDLRLRIIDLHDLIAGCLKTLQFVHDISHHAHRVCDGPDQTGDSHVLTHRHLTPDQENTADRQHHDRQKIHKDLDHRLRTHPHHCGFHIGIAVLLIGFVKFILFKVFADKCLDYTVAGNIFLGDGVHLRKFLTQFCMHRRNTFAEEIDRNKYQRRYCQQG